MGRKRQTEGGAAEGPAAALGGGGVTALHRFLPGNPYLVGLPQFALRSPLWETHESLSALLDGGANASTSLPVEPPAKHVITHESWKLVKVEPEVQDLADHFGLDGRIAGKLQEALDTREEPGEDLEVLWEILDEARNPPGLTMIKVKEMLEGTYRAGEKQDAGVKALAEKFNLDERATYKLGEVLSTRPNRKEVSLPRALVCFHALAPVPSIALATPAMQA
ncbi:unnamed protein product [Prorocentrum cordatum]|uniref:Uncharacterized protein n=1 Tax=Prorocentrum cordatum TaxID=2364126 RepID=A0ABN9PYB8_9DINO|nr:unnamed protein product [Polarella glacialis]